MIRWLDGKVERPSNLSVELGKLATAAHTDSKGRVWLGFLDGRLACYEDDKFRWFSAEDGLFGGWISSMINDSQGRLLVVGHGGISRLSNGHFVSSRIDEDTADNDIFGVTQDDRGDFWLLGRARIVKFTQRGLDELLLAHGRPLDGEQFDFNDGLRGSVAWSGYRQGFQGNPLITKRSDGTLWFATTGGIAEIDPSRIPRNPRPPPVFIQKVIASGKKYLGQGGFEFPIGTKDCQFEYAALSFVQPSKVRYRYRLDGYDDQWVEAGGRREAFYSNLRPGAYEFRVIACNNDGVWNESGATVAFKILPAFYQRAWFPVLYLVPVGLATWGLLHLRVRRVTDRLNLQIETQSNERKRIAQELHDTLLQGFTGIVMKLDVVTKSVPETLSPIRDQLLKILGQSDQYLGEARRSIWELRSKSLEKAPDFSQAVSSASKGLLDGTGIRFEFSNQGIPWNLAPHVEENLLRICKEAVSNAIKHAQPKMIRMDIAYGTVEFRLRITDDGRGFDPDGPDARKTGHFGLVGMRERAVAVGGTLVVKSNPNSGTEVLVTIPASNG